MRSGQAQPATRPLGTPPPRAAAHPWVLVSSLGADAHPHPTPTLPSPPPPPPHPHHTHGSVNAGGEMKPRKAHPTDNSPPGDLELTGEAGRGQKRGLITLSQGTGGAGGCRAGTVDTPGREHTAAGTAGLTDGLNNDRNTSGEAGVRGKRCPPARQGEGWGRDRDGPRLQNRSHRGREREKQEQMFQGLDGENSIFGKTRCQIQRAGRGPARSC